VGEGEAKILKSIEVELPISVLSTSYQLCLQGKCVNLGRG
jgi:hypothetical protein